jgi:hypothetical protein
VPSPQPPLILVDNFFDRINLYPTALLTWSTAIVGREGNYVADYRRERTYFQAAAAAANQGVVTNLLPGGASIPDMCWIDRGHNLWGTNLQVAGGADGVTWTQTMTRLVPALGTIGGDPTTSWCVTEEGALYTLLPVFVAAQYWLVRVTDNMAPLIPGIILGKRHQMLNYSSVRDEDAGERSNRVEKSLVPGYEGRDRTYARRTINLRLSTIGAAEYDTSIRALRRLLFEIDQPALVIQNYGDKPERAWLYQYEGERWSSPTTRVLRDLGLPMSELGPLVR